ncbi:unnamed protein product [Closterium sp. NIES-54]
MEVSDYIEFGVPGSVLYRGFLLSDPPASASTTAPGAVTASNKSSSSPSPPSIIQSGRGQEDTSILHPISTWNDIPIRPADSALSHGGGGFALEAAPGLDGLMAGDSIAMVCCTPRNSWVQIEAACNEACHPLRVRQVDGLPAHYSHNLDWNLGIIPQTCSCRQGDNAGAALQAGSGDACTSCDKACDEAACDTATSATMCDGACDTHAPLEVIEIGRMEARVGQVYLMKPLLAFLVVSPDLKSSWKIVAVNSSDPMAAALLDSRSGYPVWLEAKLGEIVEWLKYYKCNTVCKWSKCLGTSEVHASPHSPLIDSGPCTSVIPLACSLVPSAPLSLLTHPDISISRLSSVLSQPLSLLFPFVLPPAPLSPTPLL